MADLWFGIAVNLAVSSGVGFLVRQFSRRWSMRWVDFTGLIVVTNLGLYLVFVWDQLWQIRWIPFANVIVLGNGLPLFVAALIGLTCRRLKCRPRTRTLAVVMLALVGVGALTRPLFGQPPRCVNRWDGEVCLQSTSQTCSPASAATVLKCVGIETTEQEMAELCLTRGGTHWMGLYRGLRKKLPDSIQIAPLVAASLQDLKHASRNQPAILIVSLPREIPSEWEYRTENGWLPGVSHSVVCLGPAASGRWWIADPANGLETWSTEEMLVLWHGNGLKIGR